MGRREYGSDFFGFYRNNKLLEAINTLSIHTKLELGGIEDPERRASAREARETLGSSLPRLRGLVDQVEQGKPLMGVDASTRQLVRRLERELPKFEEDPLVRVSELLTESPTTAIRQELVKHLGNLREPIEEDFDSIHKITA